MFFRAVMKADLLWECQSPQTSQTPSSMIQLKDISDIQRVDLKPFCLEVEANNKASRSAILK